MRGTIETQDRFMLREGRLLIPHRKYNKNIDFNAYKAYRSARNRPPPTPPTPHNVLASSVVDEMLPAGTTPNASTTSLPITSDLPPSNSPGGIMPPPTTTAEPPAPYPTSFAHIVELITSGKPVPGIKEIPPTVLEGQGTEASKPKRKKPWEKDGA